MNRRKRSPCAPCESASQPPSPAARAPPRTPMSLTRRPGETLWSIAAQQQPDDPHRRGVQRAGRERHTSCSARTIKVPTVAEGAAALAADGRSRRRPPAVNVAATPSGAPRPLGAYVVRPGDTLTGLAAQTGVPVAQMAYMNGLAPDRAAAHRHRHQAAERRARPGERVRRRCRRTRVVPDADPIPDAGRLVSAEQVKALAAAARRPRLARGGDRLAGERLQQRAWSRRPTRAGSCRSCPARGTGCSRTSRRGR